MSNTINELLLSSAHTKEAMAEDPDLLKHIQLAADLIVDAVKGGHRAYTFGNGGSACDAMHFAEEMVARYKRERPGIPMMHMMDGGTLTCWSNDYSFDEVFERQVQTFCRPGDVVCGFSTSGNSANIIKGVSAAKEAGAKTIGFLGKDGGQLLEMVDIPLLVPSSQTERIQEAHITIVHILCELVEVALFGE